MVFKGVAAFLLVFGSAWAETPEEVARSKEWLDLLHYDRLFPSIFSSKSLVDGEGFFWAKEQDPLAELQATIEAFKKDTRVGTEKQHPICAFPARFQFLKKRLALDIPERKCPKLQAYLGQFNPESATLVFSSAYPNNPASMFGHTFLRINSRGSKRNDLLDFGLNYAAVVPPDENNFAFMWFGLTGGYIGQFSMTEYYRKVGEYNHYESRDLWEYDLSLNREQTLYLLRHAWELQMNSQIEYYFFDENCSYWLLSLVQVARPDWDLMNGFYAHVVPAETVKRVVRQPGAVTDIRFRPSLRNQLYQSYQAMNAQQREDFFERKTDSDPLVLRALGQYYRYQKQGKGRLTKEESQSHFKVLSALSRSKDQLDESRLPKIPKNTQPDTGHAPNRLHLAQGYLSHSLKGGSPQLYEELGIKFAYHDLMNSDQGFTRFSKVNFPNLRFRFYNRDQKFLLDRLEFFNIRSLFPFNFLEKPISWGIGGEFATRRDGRCFNCQVGRLHGGAGLTFSLIPEHWIIYSLFILNVEVGRSLRQFHRFSLLFENATIVNLADRYKFLLQATPALVWLPGYEGFEYVSFRMGHSVSLSQDWEVRSVTNWTVQEDLSLLDSRVELARFF